MQDRSAVSSMGSGGCSVSFFAAIVGFWAYNLGLSHGIAQQLPSAAGRRVSLGVLSTVGLRTVLSAVLPRVLVLRAPDLLLQAAVRGGEGGAGTMTTGADVPPMFEEWHRRAHERRQSTAVSAAALTAIGQRDRLMPAQTILVVEDEPRIAAIAADYLRHAGYQVAVAADGAQALRGGESRASRSRRPGPRPARDRRPRGRAHAAKSDRRYRSSW